MKYVLFILVLGGGFPARADYTKPAQDCAKCDELSRALGEFTAATETSAKMDALLAVTKLMGEVPLKERSAEQRRHALYAALRAGTVIMDEDFDTEGAAVLLDLRAQAETDFDYVFWRFPLAQQRALVRQMQDLKKQKVVPNARVPAAKTVE